MLKNGRIEIQCDLLENKLVDYAEHHQLSKFLKANFTPEFKGSKAQGRGDVYDLCRVMFVVGDTPGGAQRMRGKGALSIVQRLAESMQYIEL